MHVSTLTILILAVHITIYLDKTGEEFFFSVDPRRVLDKLLKSTLHAYFSFVYFGN